MIELSAPRRRLLFFAIAVVLMLAAIGAAPHHPFLIDAYVYEATATAAPLYRPDATVGQPVFLYSPTFAYAVRPLALTGAFVPTVTILALATYWWLLRPASLPVRIPLFVAAGLAVWVGNIEWILALVAA